MSELLPCPFPMEQKPIIEKKGNCYEINCVQIKRGIYIGVFVRVREDVGDEKTLAEIWNTRHYPPEVQQAIERMKPKKVTYDDSSLGKPGVPEFWIAYCPECKQPIDFNDTPFEFCRRCGQALDWSE